MLNQWRGSGVAVSILVLSYNFIFLTIHYYITMDINTNEAGGNMEKYKISLFFLFALTILTNFLFASYAIVDPWSQRIWLNGWYTAAICLNQKENLTLYEPPPEMIELNGSLVQSVGDLNNYITYGKEGVYYKKPYVHSYSCDCTTDKNGHESCSTCYECVYIKQPFTTIDMLGFSAGAWNVDIYNNALKVINFKNFSEMELTGDRDGVSLELKNAYTKFLQAQMLYEGCKNSDSYGPTNYIANTYGDSRVERWISYEQYLALIDPAKDSIPGSPCYVRIPRANGTACKNYPVKFAEAARSAMNALAKSFISADKNVELLQEQYEQMENAGLCDIDYNEKPKDSCLRAKEALGIIKQETKEATYGQRVMALEKRWQLQQKIFCFPANFSDYNSAMDYLWGQDGFNPKVVALKEDAANAFAEANSIFNKYYSDAKDYRARTDAIKSKLASEKLEFITEAVTMSNFEKTKIGSIVERVRAWNENKAGADALVDDAAKKVAQKNKGYLKEATKSIKSSLDKYSPLEKSADEIISDANGVVKEKRAAAQSLVEQLGGFYQRNKNPQVAYYYQQAQQTIAKGDSAQTLGEKYKYYAAAMAYAQTGLNNGKIIENETTPLVLQLTDLIKRAELDEVNVEGEKTILNSMKSENSYDPLLLRDSIESIIAKTSIKYGYLSDKRAELAKRINDSGKCGADLAGDLEKADSGLVTAIGIDYINALGRLKTIAAAYDEIDKELDSCQEKIILSNLNIDKMMSNGGMVKLDQPTKISLFLIITNLGWQNGTNINIPVETGINMTPMMSDITSGKDYVSAIRANGSTMIITVKEIKPLRTFSITIEKDVVLAKTISVERNAVAKEDKSADVNEKRTIEAYASGRLVLQNAPTTSSLTIDGKSLNYIQPGRHEVVYSYNVKNAYTKKEDVDTTKLGTMVNVRKTITITPDIDISSLPLSVNFDYQNVSNVEVTVQNAVISDKKCDSRSCSIQLKELKAEKSAKVVVEFMVQDAQEEMKNIVIPPLPKTDDCFGSGKKCGELPSEINTIIASINAAQDANDSATAIRLKEEYTQKIEEWKAQQESNYKEMEEAKTELTKEKEDIENALANAKSNNTLVEELKKRKDEITKVLGTMDSAATIDDAVSATREQGKNSEAIVKDYLDKATAEYNELKTRLAKTEESGTPPEFIVVEQKLSETELTGDISSAVAVADALAAAKKYVDGKEKENDMKIDELTAEYEKIKKNTTVLINIYKQQEQAAKNTEWESLFNVDIKRIDDASNEVENALNERNYKLAKLKIEQLQKHQTTLDAILQQLEKQATELLTQARAAYINKKDTLAEEIKKEIEKKLGELAGLINEKNYINAMKLAKEMLGKITTYKPETINPLLAVLAVALVVIAAGLYYIKKKGMEKQGGEQGGIKITGLELPGIGQKKKEYKRLEKVDK